MKKSSLIITLLLLVLTTSVAMAQAPEGEEYIVQRGDWLMKLARTYYGYPEAFLMIVDATNAKAAEDPSFAFIHNPNYILPGQKLWLPAGAASIPPIPAPGERVTTAIELTTNPWLWQSFTDPVQQFEVDNPENYTISFNADGSVNVKADCNNATGTYTADDNGSLSIELGPMTLAACPPESRSDEFVQKLGFVSNFFFENGVLYLDTMADGGTFQLASASEHMPSATATFGEAWESVACDTLGVAAEIAPTADCGYVTVPENRAMGSDKTVKLAVVRVRSNAANPGTPMMLAVGGPGGNGLAYPTNIQLISSWLPILADRDIIFFSQRGTYQAQPELDCPDYNRVAYEAALNNWSDEARQAQLVATMQACVDDAVSQGIDLSAYNSVENAADIDSIRQTLGYDQIILYGQSYGTLLSQFVMRNHPEILESVMIDGILAAPYVTEAEYTSQRAAFGRIFAACAADAACAAEYPDAEAVLAEVYATLEANPQPVDVALPNGQPATVTVDGSLAMNALFAYTNRPGGYATVPFAAYQMRDGNWSVLSQILPTYLFPGYDALMFFAIVCSDDPNMSLAGVDPTGVAEMYLDVEYDDVNRFVTLCPELNVTQLPDSSDELVTSDLPALLLQGGLDPATAVASGDLVGTGLSNSYNIIFPPGAHIQGGSPCATAIMAAFMADPMREPDTSCIEQGYTFAVPRTVTAQSEDSAATLSLTLPAGWLPYNDGYITSDQTTQLYLRVLPPQAPADAIKAATASFPDAPIVADDPVAGYATQHYQAEIPSGNLQVGLDFIAFGDERATYMIVTQNQASASLEQWRTVDLPALLETVTIGGE